MKAMEKTLEYHELLMEYSDTSKFGNFDLPDGFYYEFYKDGDMDKWIDIHILSGEFMSYEEGEKIFHDFYDNFIDKLPQRMIFISNSDNLYVGTGTISLLKDKEFGFDAVVDWFAIRKDFQGKKLAKPFINKLISLANTLGHSRLLLHTQTHTWLAAKIYLDTGFVPFNMDSDIKGWQILKTIMNHPKLNDVSKIDYNDIYFDDALKIEKELDRMFKNYEYSIYHKNGKHDVEVRSNNKLYKYKYEIVKDEVIFHEEVVEVVFGHSCFKSISESKLNKNDIIMFNVLFNVGDLLDIDNFMIKIPEELCFEDSNYLFREEVLKIKEAVSKNKKIRVWCSHKDIYSYLVFLYICFIVDKDSLISVVFTDKCNYVSPSIIRNTEFVDCLVSEVNLTRNDIEKYSNILKELISKNSFMRVMNNDKVLSVNIDYYDEMILKQLNILGRVKVSRLVGTLMGNVYLMDNLYVYIIKRLINDNKIKIIDLNDRFFDTVIEVMG